jgi:hypothetical protein
MNILTDDDIKFLKDLAIELKTQDREYTAKPVFYQIREKKNVVGIDPDYADKTCILLSEEYILFTDFNEAIEWCEDYLEDLIQKDIDEWWEVKLSKSFLVLHDFLKNIGYEFSTYTGYTEKHTYKNCFLTKRALDKHITENHYHYKQPDYFINHAWRNPELQQLLEIVEKFADVEI